MAQQVPTRRQATFAAIAASCALVLLFGMTQSARAQEFLRQSYATPGNARPIQLYADNIATWSDGDKQIFVLKGRVWIEQSVLNIRGSQAVVWVDQASKKESGTYSIKVYAEAVTAEDGKSSRAAKTALLDLSTRGEVRIKSYANKAVQQKLADDPLFKRATDVLKSAAPAPAQPAAPVTGHFASDGAIQLTQAVVPAPPLPGSAAPPPMPPPQPIPSGTSPLNSPPGDGKPKKITIRPRSGTEDIKSGLGGEPYSLPTGETALVINTGVIITVSDPITNNVLLDIEGDRVVVWIKGDVKDLLNNMRSQQSEPTKSPEFYLSGNVEIRNQAKAETETIRADEVYYDVSRNVAIAIRADLEIKQPKLPYPIHFKADELQQLNAKLFLAKQAEIYSTVLPSDPGLKIQVREAKIEEFETIKKSIFGRTVIDSKTGQPLEYRQHIFSGESNVVRLEGVPIFYAPRLTADVERPLGPLDTVSFNYNRIMGFQIFTTWDLYELIGLQRPDNNRWKLFVDGMTARGPALGTEFDSAGKDLLGINNKYEGMIKLYGIYDNGNDILGGNRGQQILVSSLPQPVYVPIEHPLWRGRIFGNLNVQEMPLGFSVQAQVAALSDRNFLEQFYPNDFMNGPNQETFLYAKQQNNIWAWTFLAEANFQRWMTATDWLPKADGYVLGLKFFDLFTYDVHASAGYGQLRPNTVVPFAYQPTEQRDNTGRFDIWQDISLPFTLGAFKVVPYANLDLTEYTQDLTGESRGRVYGGGGVRASIPFSRLYPDVHSELFNVNGIFHKIVLSGNYYVAQTNTHYTVLPQLDQLNDNTSDQALRDIRPWQPIVNPNNAAILASPIFDPQIYALRRLVFSATDTLDDMQVFQLDLRQRWQTKRGDPANPHVIDWMTLDVQASIYPNAQRDSFGTHWGDIEYDWVWNIGDRTALVSNGWFEPINNGPRVFNIGTYIGRPDRTSFYLGYRQIDPLQSRAIITSVTYAFSAKYALTFGSNFDVGNHIQTNSLMISRIGTDVTVSLGLNYNSIVHTFGVQFEIVPNLLPANARGPGTFGSQATAMANR